LKGLSWVRVRWFFRKEDTSAARGKVICVTGNNPLDDSEIAKKEVFASLAEDDNFLSTIDGVRNFVRKFATIIFS
jgi:spore coat polysaccharide biosynthesis protein SpsF (cytidylyltransferase family)